ncbi:cation diffusion facilitator family transporter [Thermodesulfobacterium thermophilum]|uniref:cation diffusion facilitator family transporter n=1 Tax=Thermodesulfobacterium thermophilum TaxID=886 RepID=UPI0003B500A3|nr:cation diffusion facilitator family transporter [Thermodesulfobacterium thermophilum]
MHHHHHGHDEKTEIRGKNLFYVALLNLLITVFEFIGGLVSGSMALLSDAFHNLGDVMSVVITYFAHKISLRNPNERKTFGYKRITILASLFNSVTLLIICFFLIKESIERLVTPSLIDVKTVFVVGSIGFLGNLLSLKFLKGSAKEDLNVKSAYLHMLGDALSSLTVIAGAVFIYYFGWLRVDPVISIIIAFYIAKESLEVLLKSVDIIMQATPFHVEIPKIVEGLLKIQDIQDVHHIHVWSLDDKTHFFEGHVNLKSDMNISETAKVLQSIQEELKKFDIHHITIQFEYQGVCPECEVFHNNFLKRDKDG